MLSKHRSTNTESIHGWFDILDPGPNESDLITSGQYRYVHMSSLAQHIYNEETEGLAEDGHIHETCIVLCCM